MTTNQTIDGVPRDLLERIAEVLLRGGSASTPYRELRALPDEPAIEVLDKCGVQMIDCPECSHQWDHFFECGNKYDTQPKGAPVPVDALSTGFYTTDSGGEKYAINIGFRSMADMQTADAQFRELLKSR